MFKKRKTLKRCFMLWGTVIHEVLKMSHFFMHNWENFYFIAWWKIWKKALKGWHTIQTRTTKIVEKTFYWDTKNNFSTSYDMLHISRIWSIFLSFWCSQIHISPPHFNMLNSNRHIHAPDKNCHDFTVAVMQST